MTAPLPPPARFAGAMRYVHTDIPAGMTVAQWRRRRRRAHRRSSLSITRLLRSLSTRR